MFATHRTSFADPDTGEDRALSSAATARMPSERRDIASRAQLLNRVRAEFKEMPCLRLTCGQARRLFGMTEDVCRRVLAALIREGLLSYGPDGRYGVRADVTWHSR